MKKMKCEICGSIDIKKTSDDVFECQECGIQYTKAEAIKLLTEVDLKDTSLDTVAHDNTSPTPTASVAPSASVDNSESWDPVLDDEDDLDETPAWSDPKLDFTAARKIEELLRSGNKLAAIGAYREATGLGLADAKAAVEKIALKLK